MLHCEIPQARLMLFNLVGSGDITWHAILISTCYCNAWLHLAVCKRLWVSKSAANCWPWNRVTSGHHHHHHHWPWQPPKIFLEASSAARGATASSLPGQPPPGDAPSISLSDASPKPLAVSYLHCTGLDTFIWYSDRIRKYQMSFDLNLSVIC